MVGPDGLEPSTPRLSSACSNRLSYEPSPSGGVDRFRTDDLLHAKQALYQLSYDPKAALNIAFFRPVVKHHRSGKLLCALFRKTVDLIRPTFLPPKYSIERR